MSLSPVCLPHTLLAAASTQAAVASALSAGNWALTAVCAIFAIAVAWFAGVFRRHSIDGPVRIPAGGSGAVLWLIALGGFAATVFAQIACVVLMRIRPESMSLHQTVVVSSIDAAFGLSVIIVAHVLRNAQTLERLGFNGKQIPAGFRAGLIGALVAVPLVVVTTQVMQEFYWLRGFAPPEEHVLLKVFGESAVPIDRWLVVLSAVVLAPLFEEMLFRAHVQTAIAELFSRKKRSRGFDLLMGRESVPLDDLLPEDTNPPPAYARWIAILMASALFALAHGVWWMMPPLFLLAVCLGYAYERTGNLWTSIVMHGTFNAVSILVEYMSMRGH